MFYDTNQNLIQSTYENVSKDEKIFKDAPIYSIVPIPSVKVMINLFGCGEVK